MKVPFLGSIPLDPAVASACDDGRIFIHQYAASPTTDIMRQIVDKIIQV